MKPSQWLAWQGALVLISLSALLNWIGAPLWLIVIFAALSVSCIVTEIGKHWRWWAERN